MKLIQILILNFVSLYSFSQPGWLQQNSGTTSNLNWIQFVDANTGYSCGTDGRFLKTTNGGLNWSVTILNQSNFKMVQFLNSQTGYISGDSGIVRTTNGGTSWNVIYTGSDGMYVHFTDINNGIKAGNSISMTSNGGLNWQNNFFLPPGGITGIHYFNSANVYCSGWDWIMHLGGLYTARINKSSNGGINWIYQYNSQMDVCCSATNAIYFADQNAGFAVGYERLSNYFYKSTNSGTNWIKITTPSRMYSTVFVNSSMGWMCGESGVVLYTENAGSNFYPQITNVSSVLRKIFMLNENLGYIAGDNGIILKTTNGGITGLILLNSEIPEEFSLSQNYPNPFNPSTKLKFQIPLLRGVDAVGGRGVLTILKVFNALGHEVQILVNESLQPGTYKVDWDAANYPSGVYFYGLTSGDFTQTKKMVLLK